jgi:hypothetical protein
MKYLLSLIISGALVVSGFGQTRNVLVGTNNAVVQPTNFWSADASNARSGLGLGTAATNPASAFQPSSLVLSNLASSNGVNLTNINASNIVGTNFPAFLLRTNGNGAGLTNLTAGNITGTVGLASNITGVVAVTNGGTGATNAATARTNLGATTVGDSLFTATNAEAALDVLGISTNSSNTVLAVSNIEILSFLAGSSLGFVVPTTGQGLTVRGTNLTTAVPAFFGWDGFSQTAFSAATARTNIGLTLPALTNTNNVNFLAAFFGANTNPVLVNTNGEVVSPTNFWQVAPISTTVQYQTNVTGTSTNAATNSRNLFLFSLSPSVSGITNTVTLPTNTATTFEGDRATIIHLAQTTNAVTAIRQLGAATNLITLNQLDEAVLLMYRSGAWMLADNISYVEPIFFSGTNAAANAAASRTNLGLGNILTNVVSIFNSNTAVFINTNLIATNGAGIFTNLQTGYLEFGANNGNLFVSGTNATNIIFEEPIARTNFLHGLGVGPTNNVQFSQVTLGNDTIVDGVNIKWGGNDRIELETKLFIGGDWTFDDGAINVSGETNKAITRTNLGLPLPALTNTSNVTFQAAVFATNAAPTNTANVNGVGFNTAVRWMEITLNISGTNQVFRIPLFQ